MATYYHFDGNQDLYHWEIFENNGVTLLNRSVWREAYWGDRDSEQSPLQLELIRVGGNTFLIAEAHTYLSLNSLFSGGHIGLRDGKLWVADFDGDADAEFGLVDYETPLEVFDFSRDYVDFVLNREATAAITQATRDFAANLRTDDEADFTALWQEHGPAASVAALALVLNTDVSLMLDALLERTDGGGSIYDAVLAVKAEQAN